MFDTDVKGAPASSPGGFETLDDDELAAEVARLGAQLAAGEARLVELAAEADRRGLWGGKWDARNLAEWLSWLTGMSPKSSRDHALVADKLDELPETHAALGEGTISFDQARLIASAEAPEHDAELTELARQTTTGQLQRVVRAYRKALGETADAHASHERRYLNYYFLDDRFELHGRLTTEDGAVVAKALDRARDKLFRAAGNENESVSWESQPSYVCADQLRADALVDVAESWLDEHKSGRANSYEVIVHVDADALSHDAAGARCEIDGAGAIAPETARRLTCDSALVGLVEADGEPLSIGKRSRRVPHGMRRALEARDRTCRFPGCANVARLDSHHIVHWTKDGGETELPNLLLLCKRHHRMVHEGGYTMSQARDGTWIFTRPTGDVVELPQRPPSSHEELTRSNELEGREREREPYAPEGAGEGIDLDYVTWALFFQ
jgi:Domain of unknown function (DUF222)/HNH endonuclease